MSRSESIVCYWDTSAIVSTLIADRFSNEASAAARALGLHVMSSLALAEVVAVIARSERDGTLSASRVADARRSVETGPWILTSVDPAAKSLSILARRWPLRGADLWHLAAAKALQADLPELRLLSFDARLDAAAAGEGLS